MGLLVGVGDFGIGDLVAKAQNLYNLLADLCNGQLRFADILETPDTLAGYGITDAFTQAQIIALLNNKMDANFQYSYNDLLDLPTNIAESGILDVYTKQEVEALIEDLAIEHTHEIDDIIGLPQALAGLKFKIVSTIPATPTPHTIYCVYGFDKFTLYVTDDNTPANVIALDAVTSAALATALNSKQNKLNGDPTYYVKADGSFGLFDKAAIGLGNVANMSPSAFPISDAALTALAAKANDSEVLKKTGNQTKTSGVLTFALSPVVPSPQSSSDAANKGYVDSAVEAGQTEWFEIEW